MQRYTERERERDAEKEFKQEKGRKLKSEGDARCWRRTSEMLAITCVSSPQGDGSAGIEIQGFISE